ncbi:hypothetical protein MMC34_003372 [Xylographa carneopallida]|nr:hypothetical protein [Xylographa carneopallida]
MADADTEYIQSIPWCAKLLADPTLVMIPTSTRKLKQSTEDALFAETLKTDDTIRAWVALFRQPLRGSTKTEEVYTLVSLGYGLNGYPHICHGGIVATIMDEVMSTLLSVNKNRNGVSGVAVTASLNINFLKPVWTPQVVLVSARFREIKGRKIYLESTVRDNGRIILAKAEALFMRIDGPSDKL